MFPLDQSLKRMDRPSVGFQPESATQFLNAGGFSSPRVVAPVSSMKEEVLDKDRLQELAREVDPLEQLDEETMALLLRIADDFIEQTVVASCAVAKHRKSPKLGVRDVQLVLEKNYNLWVPGGSFSAGSEGVLSVRRAGKRLASDAHRGRMALIRKHLKKY